MTATQVPAPDTARARSAPSPVAAAGASIVGVLLALVLIAAGAIAVRDAALAAGLLHGRPWLPAAIDAVDVVSPATWMLPAGIVVTLLGMALVVVAFLPRRATATALAADTSVYVRHGDIATVATAAALDVPGVLDARSTATRRKVTVRCRVTGDAAEVRTLVADAVADALRPLHRAPRLAVHTREDRS